METKGINNAAVRLENRKRVIEYLFLYGKKTKQELSVALSISLPTIHTLVAQLEGLGLIVRESADTSSGGRIPSYLCIQYDAYYAFGLEITHNCCRLILENMGEKILDRKTVEITFSNTDEYWDTLNSHVEDMAKRAHIPHERIMGIGIAVPGTVKDGLVEFAPTLGLKNFNVSSLNRHFDLPMIVIDNEANAAGLAETRIKGNIKNSIYLSITKGVGGALIQDGTITSGENGHCGEFGHITLIPHGVKCSCGKHGCLEAYCSTKILSDCAEGDLNQFFHNLPSNKQYREVWDQYLENLSIGISNLIIAFDLPLILGGNIVPGIEKDFDRLVQMVISQIPFPVEKPIVLLSSIGSDAAAIGGAIDVTAKYLIALLMNTDAKR